MLLSTRKRRKPKLRPTRWLSNDHKASDYRSKAKRKNQANLTEADLCAMTMETNVVMTDEKIPKVYQTFKLCGKIYTIFLKLALAEPKPDSTLRQNSLI